MQGQGDGSVLDELVDMLKDLKVNVFHARKRTEIHASVNMQEHDKELAVHIVLRHNRVHVYRVHITNWSNLLARDLLLCPLITRALASYAAGAVQPVEANCILLLGFSWLQLASPLPAAASFCPAGVFTSNDLTPQGS